MFNALYSNGMIGGDDLRNELDSINERYFSERERLLTGVEPEDDEEVLGDADSPLMKAMNTDGP